MSQQSELPKAVISVEQIDSIKANDLNDLCDVTDEAIVNGGGFGWLQPPARERLEAFWKGMLIMPERDVFVGRLDGVIAGSAQLLRPSSNHEATARVGHLTTFFVAPWARGHGLGVELVKTVEIEARGAGLGMLNLDVRESQTRAIQIYEQNGFKRWGSNPRYAFVDGRWVSGHYYHKSLVPGDSLS